MAEKDPADDGLSIHDLIKDTEESMSFEDYLARRNAWKPTTQSTTSGSASDAAATSSSSTSGSGATDSSPSSSAPAVTSQKEFLEKHPGLAKTGGNEPPAIVPIPTATPDPIYSRTVAPVTPEFTEKVYVENHPIVGHYTRVEQEIVPGDLRDDEIYISARHKGITEMTWQEVQDRIHAISDQIQKGKRAQQGLMGALEEHLSKMNMQEKASYLERDKAYRSPRKTKAEGGEKTTRSRTASGSPSPKAAGIDNKVAKSVQAYKSMGLTCEETIEEIKGLGKLTPEVEAYAKKLWGV